MLFLTLLIALLLSAVVFDLKTCRIPNALILSGAFLGLCYLLGAAIDGDCPQEGGALIFILLRLLGSTAMLFLLGPFWKLHVIGGGDVKLTAVLVLFLGFSKTVTVLILSLIWALVLSLLRHLLHLLLPDRVSGLIKRGDMHICRFSPALFLGVLCLVFLGDLLPNFL